MLTWWRRLFFLMIRQPPRSPVLPYATRFGSLGGATGTAGAASDGGVVTGLNEFGAIAVNATVDVSKAGSEKHGSTIQSPPGVVCPLLPGRKIKPYSDGKLLAPSTAGRTRMGL